MKSFSHVWLFATPWTAAYQAPAPMGFSRQEYWSGVSLPSLWMFTVAIFIVAKIWKPPRLFFSWLKKSIHFFLIEIWKISHWNVKDFYCFTSWSSWFTIPKSHHFVRKEHYIPDKVIQKLQQPSSFPLTFSPPPGEKTILGQPCSRRRDTQNRPNLNLRPGHNSSPMFPWTLAVWHRSKHYTHISIWYMVYIPFLLLEPTFRQRLVYFIHDHRT